MNLKWPIWHKQIIVSVLCRLKSLNLMSFLLQVFMADPGVREWTQSKHRYRKVVSQLGNLVKLETTRLTVHRLLELSESVDNENTRELLLSPKYFSHCLMPLISSVAQGGYLFEYFIDHNASQHYMRMYRDCLNKENGKIGQESTKTVVRCLGYKFLGFVCMILNISGNSAREQMFFSTYAARYHGLSRSGVNMLAAIGNMMPMSTLDDIAKEYHERNRAVTR